MSWVELTSTSPCNKLSDAPLWCGNPGAPAPPNCLSKTLGGSGGPPSTIDAWVTGALDTSRARFTFPAGGGHADWPGNQVISWSTGAGWTMQRNASTAFPPMTASSSAASTFVYKYTDGTPSSKHTYDSIVYMPTVDRFWCGGGIYWSPGGNSVPQVCWWWDPNTNNWAEKAIRPGGYGINSVWDPVGQRVLMRLSSAFVAYDPQLEVAGANAAAYTTLFSQTGTTVSGSTPAFDSVGRKFYRIIPRGTTPQITMIDLNNLSAKEVFLATTGDVQIETLVGGAQGCIYADGRIVALGPSNIVGQLSVYTAIVDGHGQAGQPPVQWVKDAATANEPFYDTVGHRGTWKKFFGPLASGKYYFIGWYDKNVWEYTPTWSVTTKTVDLVGGLTIVEV